MHVTIKTTVSDEMYNCIESPTSPPSSPQHHNLNNGGRDNGSRSHHLGNSSNGSNGYSDRRISGFEISHHSASYDEDDDDSLTSRQGPTNENLLGTAFCSFMGFALVQTVVAAFAGSEAMLGDSAAMIVDALTYLFNWFAERKKSTYETQEWRDSCPMPPGQDAETRQRILTRTKRKKILQLELIPPLMSVSTLIVVTAYVLNDSIRVLILDVHRSVSQQGNPNIHIMMYFSIANLGLDLINVANFAKAKHLFGYETSEHSPRQGHEALSMDVHDDDEDTKNMYRRWTLSHEDLEDCDEDQDHTANLNMCSAYTVSLKLVKWFSSFLRS